MHTNRSRAVIFRSLLLALVALLVLAVATQAAPWQGVPLAGEKLTTLQGKMLNPPSAACTTATDGGGIVTRTCDLYATTGSLSLPLEGGGTLATPIWGFVDSAANLGAASLPGPTLEANQGEILEVVFHNELAGVGLNETVGVIFQGQDNLFPDNEGIAPGGTRTYRFELQKPGTFKYEAGLTPNGARQTLMGLNGMLIVRPLGAPVQAYAGGHTVFTKEAVLVFSEVDPLFHNDPLAFNVTKYAPKFWLINGQPFPNSAIIDVGAGDAVLMRYLNAGSQNYTIGVLGLDQYMIAVDGGALQYPYGMVAEVVPAGETLDTIVNIPATTQIGTSFAVYESSLHQHNDGTHIVSGGVHGQVAFGGILTFLNATGGQPTANVGPVVTAASVAPTVSAGATDIVVSATLEDKIGGENVVEARYFVGDLTTAAPIALTPGTPVDVSVTIPQAEVSGWVTGDHPIYVQGRDAKGAWGPVSSVVFKLDNLGPEVIGVNLAPNPTNGTKSVTMTGTADDHNVGSSNIQFAEFRLAGGAWQPVTLNQTASPFAGLQALIPQAVVNDLPEGAAAVEIRAQDALGNVGGSTTVNLNVDRSGPTTSQMVLTPAALDLRTSTVRTVRVGALITDLVSGGIQSQLVTAEVFIDQAGAAGSGQEIIPSDGLFNSPQEQAYFNIDVANFARLSEGQHPVYIRGLDKAGNWGALASAMITVVKGPNDGAGPQVSALVADPNPTNGAASVALTALAADLNAQSNVVAAEWFIDPLTPTSLGFAMTAADGAFNSAIETVQATISTASWAPGPHVVRVRAQDAAGHWGRAAQMTVRVSGSSNAALILADNFNGALAAWSQSVGTVSLKPIAQIGTEPGTQGVATMQGLAVSANGNTPSYLSLVSPAGERGFQASFAFDPNSIQLAGERVTIFGGQSRADGLFGIELAAGATAGTYETRAWVKDIDGAIKYLPDANNWQDLSDAVHTFQVEWTTGATPEFILRVDGVEVGRVVAKRAAPLMETRLGLVEGLAAATVGEVYFDQFLAVRSFTLFAPMVSR